MIRTILAACFCALIFLATSGAEARPRIAHDRCNIDWPCEGVAPSPRGLEIARRMRFGGPQQIYTPRTSLQKVQRSQVSSTVIGGRPAGCPRAYCGCGTSLEHFGKIIPFYNLAANWLTLPRSAPASGMVAARRGHVFTLKQHVAGSVWIVKDYNSGRGLTRIHARSIAGYSIVNPHAARYASVQ